MVHMEQTIEVLVEAGKATAAPPLGPALGPLGVNIMKVVEEINEKTKGFKGMKVPVKITVNTENKSFTVEVGKPPVTSLILKELGIEKGSAFPNKDRVGDLTLEQVKKIALAKFDSTTEAAINQVKGSCRSMGITIDKGAVTQEELKREEEDKRKLVEEKVEGVAVEEKVEVEEVKEEKPEEKPKEEKKKRKIRKGKS